MHKKRFLAGATLVLTSSMLLTGCFGGGAKTSTPTPSASGTGRVISVPGSGTTPSSTPKYTPTIPQNQPTGIPTESVDLGNPSTKEGMLANAQAMFSDVKATGDLSKSDVQLALFVAQTYANASQNTAIFLKGQWVQRGQTRDNFDAVFGQLLTFDKLAEYENDIDHVKADATSQDALLRAVLYSKAPTTALTICPGDTTACQVEGYPRFTNYNIGKGEKANSLYVELTVTSALNITQNGKKYTLPVTTTMELRLLKNKAYTGVEGTYPFQVDDIYNVPKFGTPVAQ